MTLAANKAYFNPENTERRKTHTEIVKDCYFFPRTIREASNISGLTYNQVQKRTSELLESGEIKIMFEKTENGNPNSVFACTGNKPNSVKKQTLRSFLKEHYPYVLVEFEQRIDHRTK